MMAPRLPSVEALTLPLIVVLFYLMLPFRACPTSVTTEWSFCRRFNFLMRMECTLQHRSLFIQTISFLSSKCIPIMLVLKADFYLIIVGKSHSACIFKSMLFCVIYELKFDSGLSFYIRSSLTNTTNIWSISCFLMPPLKNSPAFDTAFSKNHFKVSIQNSGLC